MGSSECESIEKYKFEAMENGESFNYQGNAKLEISIVASSSPHTIRLYINWNKW